MIAVYRCDVVVRVSSTTQNRVEREDRAVTNPTRGVDLHAAKSNKAYTETQALHRVASLVVRQNMRTLYGLNASWGTDPTLGTATLTARLIMVRPGLIVSTRAGSRRPAQACADVANRGIDIATIERIYDI